MAGDGDKRAENGQNHGERSVFNGLELSSPQRVEETPEVMEELEKDNKGGGGPHAAAPAVTTTGEGVEGDGKSAKGAGKAAVPKVPFMQLFKFADAYDKLLMVLGFLGAVGDGATTPGMLFVMSGLINVFGQMQSTTNFMHEISKVGAPASSPESLLESLLCVALSLCSSLFLPAFALQSGEHLLLRLRNPPLSHIQAAGELAIHESIGILLVLGPLLLTALQANF